MYHSPEVVRVADDLGPIVREADNRPQIVRRPDDGARGVPTRGRRAGGPHGADRLTPARRLQNTPLQRAAERARSAARATPI